MLAVYSDRETSRLVAAGSYRMVSILVAYNDMYVVYTCTRTVFEQVLEQQRAGRNFSILFF